MSEADREAWITGIGLVSSLGEGPAAHWAALDRPDFTPVLDSERFVPFLVHPMPALPLDQQIPKRGDQRQMEPWQRIGTYAAGLALDDAGVKGDAALLARMHMIVAAGGGERDCALDCTILSDLPTAADPAGSLNQRLMNGLRPTLFLAQLSNLLAGNISIVHGVVGGSRTFMGEEASGVDAVRIACARIEAGQGGLFLVGGAFNAERPDVLLHYAMGHVVRRQPYAGIWSRQAESGGGGLVLGSVGCFLVIESGSHATARGVRARARISAIGSERGPRRPGAATARARLQLARMPRLGSGAAVLSGASGVAAATAEEAAFLGELGLPVRAVAGAIGHSIEPSFPASLAMAAIAIEHGRLFPPIDPSGPELAMRGALRQVLVTGWGHWRGEGMALVEPAA